jgi:hypothetical protein
MLLDSPGFPPAVIRPTPRAGAPAAAGTAASPTAAGAHAATGWCGAAVGATGARVGILPVTTLQQAVRIALDRTRRMTLLGAVPGVGPMVLPWLLPLHLLIVGLTADHIRHTPDASLSYSDGTAPRAHRGAVALALLLGPAWFVVLGGAICMLSSHDLDTAAALLLAAAAVVPVVEFLSLVEFAALNPEWVKLKKVRGRRSDRRTAFVLTSLVSSRDGCGAARRLMDLTYPQWQAVDAVVIGYPASKSLISYYIRMGARRSDVPGPDGRRPVGRSVTFDCRRPLRVR